MNAVAVGTRLGRYELVGELGQGGMSVVYRGRDTMLHRDVAVKVMHGFLAEQAESRERFRREARAVAGLSHPHIIEVFDVSDEDADVSYIIAELVDGQSLASLLGGQAVTPPEAALVLARPLADALRHAHEKGVIHRDLKPENVLVDPSGKLKLTDFGIARMLDNQTLTVTGTLLGSPAYMAPEYIDGQEPDARSDIFSFGAMLYQLCVGQLPFTGPTPHALLKRIASGEYVPCNQRNPAIHSAIARLIHRCLARDPIDRFPTAAALLAAIDALLDEIGIDADADRPALLADRAAYGEALLERLAVRYLELGRRALVEGRRAEAIEHLDRVLGIEPANREVRVILDRLARRDWLWRGLRAGGLGVIGAALATASALLWLGRPEPIPASAPPAEPLASEAPAPVVDPRRVILLDLEGVGDVFVDGALYEDEYFNGRARSGTKNRFLVTPGPHRITFVGKNRQDEIEIVVPETGLPPDYRTLDVRDPAPRRPATLMASATSTGATGSGAAVPPAADAPPVRRKMVSFNTKQWVNIYVGDSKEPIAATKQGKFDIELPYGEHELHFTNQYARPETRRVLVSDDSPPGVIVIDLEPMPAKLHIVGLPEGNATIEVADKRVTLNDLNRGDAILVDLSEGRRHTVRITKPGFAPFEQPVTFTAGATRELRVRLQPLP